MASTAPIRRGVRGVREQIQSDDGRQRRGEDGARQHPKFAIALGCKHGLLDIPWAQKKQERSGRSLERRLSYAIPSRNRRAFSQVSKERTGTRGHDQI